MKSVGSAGVVLLAVMLGACGGNTVPTPPPDNPPTVTAPGTPVGNPVTQTIGAAGGTIQTVDGKIQITVPAGALTSSTQLTLQPVTQALPGGLGLAYELSPQNVTFSQPLQIRFQPPEADQAGASDAQGVAVQDDSGAWFALGGAQVAPASVRPARVSSITAQLRRLNRGTRLIKAIGVYARLRLTPANASVRNGQRLTLKVAGCDPVPPAVPPARDDDDLAPIGCGSPGRNADSLNASAGTLTQVSRTQLRYTAPGQTPSPNPVNLTVTYNGVAGSARVILLGGVRVVDGFQRYSGPLSYRYSISGLGDWVGTGEITYDRFEDFPDVARYSVSKGSFVFTYTPKPQGLTCPSQQFTLDALMGESNGTIIFWKDGSNPGKVYNLSLGSKTLATSFNCRDSEGKLIVYKDFVSVGFASTGDLPYTDEGTLEATNHPIVLPPTGEGSASWRLSGE